MGPLEYLLTFRDQGVQFQLIHPKTPGMFLSPRLKIIEGGSAGPRRHASTQSLLQFETLGYTAKLNAPFLYQRDLFSKRCIDLTRRPGGIVTLT